MDSFKEGREPTAGSDASAAAAADELASMSFGSAAPAPANVEDDKFCSNGGETAELKGCNGCRCIRYCSAKCQKKHWKIHKKECKRIEAVLKKGIPGGGKYYLDFSKQVDGEESGLFDEPPKNPDCDICMVRLPMEQSLWLYWSCCGKSVCCACDVDNENAIAKQNEKKAERKQKLLERRRCPFCRTPEPEDAEECISRLKKKDGLGDARATWLLATFHKDGAHGAARDETKALQLYGKAADLGDIDARATLGFIYQDGLFGAEVDLKKAIMHLELAAKGGHVLARDTLGVIAVEKVVEETLSKIRRDPKNRLACLNAILHWRISAAAGYTPSVIFLVGNFEMGLIRHKDLASSLQARDKARLEMKSESRDRYIKHLKRTGELEERGIDDIYA